MNKEDLGALVTLIFTISVPIILYATLFTMGETWVNNNPILAFLIIAIAEPIILMIGFNIVMNKIYK